MSSVAVLFALHRIRMSAAGLSALVRHNRRLFFSCLHENHCMFLLLPNSQITYQPAFARYALCINSNDGCFVMSSPADGQIRAVFDSIPIGRCK